MGGYYVRRGKRQFDVLGAAAGLIVSAPVQLSAALAIWLRMGSPVLFRQLRPGQGGVPFTLLKLRTMRARRLDEDAAGSDAERITRLGAFLRASSIDELPELWNVLVGEMSLVGPRPLLMEYLPLYSEQQRRRHEVRPGLTGWAQVNGRNSLTWEEKFAHDVWYVENVTLRLDLQILWMTVVAVAKRHGITAPGHETMPEFNPVI